MKQTDFTKTGGFPLTQDALDYMQQSYTEAISAIAGGLGAGPYILSGCVLGGLGPVGVNMSAGWIFYNGEVCRMAPTTLTTGTGIYGCTLQVNNTTLVYNDGSTNPTAQQEKYFQLGFVPDNTLSAGHFPLTALVPLTEGSADMYKDVFVLSNPVIGASGTITITKNWLTNMLHIGGVITITNAQAIAATDTSGAPGYGLVNSLNNIAAPLSDGFFALYVTPATGSIKDDTGAPLRQLYGVVNTLGDMLVQFVRPATGVTTYTVSVNALIPCN